MAEKRMFTQKIIDSDAFLDMPLSTQALYFHLNMRADDDGFVNNPKRIQRTIGASDDDLKLLIAKRFVIGFNSGVIVIKHWRMHNTLRKDRYNPTQYQDELSLLDVKENNAYTEKQNELPYHENEIVETTWQPNGNHLEPQYSKVKCSLVECSVVEDSKYIPAPDSPSPPAKSKKHKFGEFKKVLLSDEEYEKLCSDFGKDETDKAISFFDAYIAEKGYKSKSHYLAMRRWVFDAVKDRKPKNQQKSSNPFLDLLEEGDYE